MTMEIDERVDQAQSGDIFDDLTNVEGRFYDEGYKSGYDHGKLHGLFEGRELGREKGWEIWEEVGFYEGWAGLHKALLEHKGVVAGGRGKESRALSHSKILLDLVAKFPMINPSETATIALPTNDVDDTEMEDGTKASTTLENGPNPANVGEKEVDLPTLLSSIRARYKLLCTSLGVRPRLTAASAGVSAQEDAGAQEGSSTTNEGIVSGIEGPMKGVDTRQLRF